MPSSRLFLGLDSSTQSLSAILIDFDKRTIVWEKSINFEKVFPEYKTISGTLSGPETLVVHSPPLMWAEALDRLFEEMVKEGVDLKAIAAISGSAQQHGSVYLNETFSSRLAHLDPKKNLKQNLAHVFSRETAPIWMDASTAEECREIREALGSSSKVIEATGSNTFERFTGPQIRKFFKKEPKGYAKTATIALVSSYMASLLAGKISPIDYGDGSGMNLMDIQAKKWHPKALSATAPDLHKKLPPLSESWRIVGPVAPYFVAKYGLNPRALSLVWSGDNPSSLLGLGLIDEGVVGISIGTSFTYFGTLKQPHFDPLGEGHLFVSPTGDYMALNCFLNGALAIQKMRNLYSMNWDDFDQALASTPPGNHGSILLPYFQSEIIPKVLHAKLHRFDLSEKDAAANCRALVEAQMLSMRLHASWMRLKPHLILATGGVSHQSRILQIMADVHRCPVKRSSVAKSTALGAALCAAFGYLTSIGKPSTWTEIGKGFTDPLPEVIQPDPKAVGIYDQLLRKYEECEKKIVSI